MHLVESPPQFTTPPALTRDTPSTAATTPGVRPGKKVPPLPWAPAPYPLYDPYGGMPGMTGMGWEWWMQDGFQYMPEGFPMEVGQAFMSEKKERKPRRNRSSPRSGAASLSNPARPRLQELRNLPQRGLGLRYVSDDRKFEVVKLHQSTPCESPGPSATVVRADSANVLEAEGGSKVLLPKLEEGAKNVVCWTVDEWVARRFETAEGDWSETDAVALEDNASGTEVEWARRFAQREKQLLVGKGTRGYRRFLRIIPKPQRKAGDPQTPRVAEQCSKRAFDGRLKQWRILLHAFSPRESEDEAEDEPQTPKMQKPAAKANGIPPTPPKPSMQFSDMSPEKDALKVSEKMRKGPSTPSPLTTLSPQSVHSPFPDLPCYTGPMDGYDFPELSSGLAQLTPYFQDFLSRASDLDGSFLGAPMDLPEIPPPPGLEEMEEAELLPKDLLEQQQEKEKDDSDAALDRANVPEQLRSVFKEAFQSALTSSAEDKDLMYHNAARAVVNALSPKDTPTMDVLEVLLRYINELRAKSD